MVNVVETAIALNLIFDIIERFEARNGVKITPENIAEYVEERKARRKQLNVELGISES